MNRERKQRSEKLASQTGGRVRPADLRGHLAARGAVDNTFRPTAAAVEAGLAERDTSGRPRWIIEAVVDSVLAARQAESTEAKASPQQKREPKRVTGSPRNTPNPVARRVQAERIAREMHAREQAGDDKSVQAWFESIEMEDPDLARLVADEHDRDVES